MPGYFLIPQVLDNQPESLRRFTQKVKNVLDGLILTGGIIPVGPGQFTIPVGQVALTFEYNNATVRKVGTIPAGRIACRSRVILTEAFTDPTSTLTIGTLAVPDRFMRATDSALYLGGEFELAIQDDIGTTTDVYLTLASAVGETTGAGVVVVEFEPIPGV